MFDLEYIGKQCQLFRYDRGYTQVEIAEDLDYCVENISAFERGKNDNLRIYLWYVLHGFTETEYYNNMILGLKGVTE